jgi:hypothetical protein
MGEKEKSIRKAILKRFPELKISYGKGRWSSFLHVRSQKGFTLEERLFLIEISGREDMPSDFCSINSKEVKI